MRRVLQFYFKGLLVLFFGRKFMQIHFIFVDYGVETGAELDYNVILLHGLGQFKSGPFRYLGYRH